LRGEHFDAHRGVVDEYRLNHRRLLQVAGLQPLVNVLI
jgi:hypothetical protein